MNVLIVHARPEPRSLNGTLKTFHGVGPQHGILYYPGFDVLPPFIVYRSDTIDEIRYQAMARELEARLLTIDTAEPIAYRMQNGGDYDIPALTLKPGLETDGHPWPASAHTRPRAPPTDQRDLAIEVRRADSLIRYSRRQSWPS